MRILLGTGHPYIPQIAGGAQSSTHEIAEELKALGHTPAALVGLSGSGWLAFRARLAMKLRGRSAVRDDLLGYPVYRAWYPWDAVEEVKAAFAPDVALVQSGFPIRLAQAFEAAGVPVATYFRNVEDYDMGGDPRELKLGRFISNSQFTASTQAQRYGVKSTVIYPIVQTANYRTATDRSHVVFINPHVTKGLDIALATAAACPDIPFLFVEAWVLSADQRAELVQKLSVLPNVTLMPRTRDMRQVYSKARFVLAPSQWEEAFGRIAAEAQCSGIPVVASSRGGLPEAVGPGGVLLGPDASPDDWARTVRRLWTDSDYYERLSADALVHSKRPELDRSSQIAALLGVLDETVRDQKAGFGQMREGANDTTLAGVSRSVSNGAPARAE